MTKVNALVLRAAGINCDEETQHALALVGAHVERRHINEVIKDHSLLKSIQILVFPGGFSYGDDVAAGKILANQLVHHLHDCLRRFIDEGNLVLGICNGFQVLVKAGILPGINSRQTHVTITDNDSDKFEDRWVYLKPKAEHCVFIGPDRILHLPVAHGEGKVVTRDAAVLQQLLTQGLVAFQYVDQDGREGSYPVNPNGSVGSIAGLTDQTGRVLGLMPHPERSIHPTHHPKWSRLNKEHRCDGLSLFHRAVTYVRQNR